MQNRFSLQDNTFQPTDAKHSQHCKGNAKREEKKQLYWQCTNSKNTAVIYETSANGDKKTIPQKFLTKDFPNEHKDIRDKGNATLKDSTMKLIDQNKL